MYVSEVIEPIPDYHTFVPLFLTIVGTALPRGTITLDTLLATSVHLSLKQFTLCVL